MTYMHAADYIIQFIVKLYLIVIHNNTRGYSYLKKTTDRRIFLVLFRVVLKEKMMFVYIPFEISIKTLKKPECEMKIIRVTSKMYLQLSHTLYYTAVEQPNIVVLTHSGPRTAKFIQYFF